MAALGRQLTHIQSSSFLEVQMRARVQGVGQGHPFFTSNGGFNLTLEEAEEMTDRLTGFVEEIFSRRHHPVDPKDLTYFLSIDWYAQRENSEAARVVRAVMHCSGRQSCRAQSRTTRVSLIHWVNTIPESGSCRASSTSASKRARDLQLS